MVGKFADKVVLVTGASRGLGREIAISFAREGAKLVLVARSVDGLERIEREVLELTPYAISIPTDVSVKQSVANLVESAIAHFGRIDVVVNNAGIGRVGKIADPAFEDDVRDTLQASLFGMIHVTQATLPILRRQGTGAIVNMSSVMGRKAFGNFGSYAIVMHAVSAFNDALRQELAGTGIGVSVIHPALTATDLLREADEQQMPASFRHMTPLSPAYVGQAVVKAVYRGKRRLVLPRIANMLLLSEALSPRIGDLVASGLAVRPIAWLLGFSRGKTYHQVIGASGLQKVGE